MSRAPTLPPIPWQRVPITPLPDVFIDDTPIAWLAWDAAVRSLDHQPENAQ